MALAAVLGELFAREISAQCVTRAEAGDRLKEALHRLAAKIDA